MDPEALSLWWQALGTALGAGALLGALVALVNSWKT